jgi:HEAT repeat protein
MASEYDRLLAALASPETRYEALADLAESSLRNAAAIAAPFLRDEDPEVRYFAAECVLARGNASYAERMLPLLRDPDATVRVVAVECMARWRVHAAWRRVLRLIRDREPLVRGYAAWALMDLGAVEALPKLRRRLPRERSPEVKIWILGTLAALDDDDACAERVEKLLRHADENVRDSAANCLVGVADLAKPAQLRRFIRSLQEAILAETEAGVRARMRKNLERLRGA